MFQRIATAVTLLTFVSVAHAGGLESTRIVNQDGSCVRANENAVVAASCTANLKQQWIHEDNGQLKNVDAFVVDGQDRCIAGRPDGTFTMADCDANRRNQIFVKVVTDGVVEYFNAGNATSLDLEEDTGSQWHIGVNDAV